MTSTGEEATQIASAAALHAEDEVFGQYREPGVLMWRGFSLQVQLFLKVLDLLSFVQLRHSYYQPIFRIDSSRYGAALLCYVDQVLLFVAAL
jgi:Dehydrogenase E1 component